MKAILCRRYGLPELVTCEEVEKPAPASGEVLIRVRAASLNPLDWHLKRGTPLIFRLMTGLRAPKDPRVGVDLAGEVEAAGNGVTQFKPGDAVFGGCKGGAFAEYVCTSESQVVLKPASLTFAQAAAAPVAAITALQGLRDKGRVEPGQKVLINGAAGGVGTFAVQMAKWMGAQVTGVCSSRNAELVRSLGADHVIDYAREDFTRSGERYDLIFDLVAGHSLGACRRALTPQGTLLIAGVLSGKWSGFLRSLPLAPILSKFGKQRLLVFGAKRSKKDMETIGELMAAGKLRAVIEECHPLGETADAIRHLEEKRARGKLVIIPGRH